MRLLDWRRLLVYTHRWLGIAGCILFITWFISGVVMMYARMPSLTLDERLARLPPLDLSSATVSPETVARREHITPDQLRIGMLDGRPVYRFVEGRSVVTTFADTGDRLAGLTDRDALAVARAFMPEHAATIRYDALLADADQWTMGVRGLMPVHRIRIGDPDASVVYVSNLTGEPVMKSTREQRVWGYLGAVLHWIYFTPLRRQSALWNEVIIWSSIGGCLLSLSGLIWGLWRYSVGGIYRLKRIPSHTPYAGWMMWHHYAGLFFGLVTFTWILSGLLSMVPWDWSPGAAPTPVQRLAVAGGPLRLDRLTLERLRASTAALEAAFGPKELELLQFQGDSVLLAYRPDPSLHVERWNSAYYSLAPRPDHRIVSVVNPDRGLFRRFDDDAMLAAGQKAMQAVPLEQAVWLREYDEYYYDRHGAQSLPVLRMQFADPERTLLYLDPFRGEVLLNHGRLSRIERWLYHGLHSLDFPGLYSKRPLWDIVVVVLSAGGLVISATTLVPAWRRLRRHKRRLMRPKVTENITAPEPHAPAPASRPTATD